MSRRKAKPDQPRKQATPRRHNASHCPRCISVQPRIVLDCCGSSLYYLWFDPEIAHDMTLISLKRICREIERDTKKLVIIDSSQVQKGFIVIRHNIAMSKYSKESLETATNAIVEVLRATKDSKEHVKPITSKR